jgi:iron complex outermembrane receptor protein
VPSLRVNAQQFIPASNEDVERIEVVLGPGSALYGPNSANGVMHILTKSPFESKGTIISFGAGERSLLMASLRHAGVFKDRIGYKLSTQYYQGNDWEFTDTAEPKKVLKGRQTATGRIAEGDSILNKRDFNVQKIGVEARVDYRLTDDVTAIFNTGWSKSSNVELTGIGAGQAIGWTYTFFQTRLNYKELFIQAFLNRSDAGKTFLLRTGDLVIDNSSLLVGQIQHSLTMFGDRQRFTYGLDILLTRPDTENTINGRNEKEDSVNETGVYVQSETKLIPKLDLVGAIRVDDHTHLKNAVFSPRAALVFKPEINHTIRATYNRAFSTPSSNNLFLDIAVLNATNSTILPLNTFYPGKFTELEEHILSIRAAGVPSETGFTYKRDTTGRPKMRSQFDNIDGFSESTVNNVWPALRSIFVGALKLRQDADASIADEVLPQDLTTDIGQTINGIFRDPVKESSTKKREVVTTDNIKNVEPIRETITNSYEIGYKGLIGKQLLITTDVYYSNIEGFVSALLNITPTVHVDSTTLKPALASYIKNKLKQKGYTDTDAEKEADRLAGKAARGLEAVPFGITAVEQEKFQRNNGVIVTYRNYGEVSIIGLDFGITFYLNQNVNFNGNYSLVAKYTGFGDIFKNIFKDDEVLFKNVDGIQDVALNAPQHKFGAAVQYINQKLGLDTQLRFRYVHGFPINSGVYVGSIKTYYVFDLNGSYKLPFSPNTQVTLAIQNLLDKKHQEFVGAPKIGRLALLRLTHSF